MKRQPPIALIYIFIKAGGKLLRILWPFILLSIFGKEADGREQKWLWITVLITAATLISAVIHYLFFRFQVKDGQLQVSKGLIKKKGISIPLENIQAVNISQNWLQRITGVSELLIDSPGSSGKDASILLTFKEAVKFKEGLLLPGKGISVTGSAATEKTKPVYKLGDKDLFKLVISENHLKSLVILLSLLAGLFNNVQDYFTKYYEEKYAEVENLLLQSTLLIFGWLLLLAFLISLVVSAVRVIGKYANFEIISNKKGLLIHKGLVSRDQKLVPVEKVQLLRWSANVLRKKLDLSEFKIFSIGSESVKDLKVDIPVTNSHLLNWLINRFTGSFADTHQSSIRMLPLYFTRRAIIYFIFIIATIIVAWYINPYISILVLFFIYSIFSSFYRVKNFRLHYNDEILYLQHSSFGSRDALLKWVNVQYVEISQSFFQRRRGIASLRLHTAGGAITVPYIPLEDARKICDLSLYKMETTVWNYKNLPLPISADREF